MTAIANLSDTADRARRVAVEARLTAFLQDMLPYTVSGSLALVAEASERDVVIAGPLRYLGPLVPQDGQALLRMAEYDFVGRRPSRGWGRPEHRVVYAIVFTPTSLGETRRCSFALPFSAVGA